MKTTLKQSFAIYPSLKNRSVLITGGASGIGAAMVEHFCAQGSHVAFLDVNEKAALELIAHIKSKYHYKPLFISCDLKNINALKNAIMYAREKLGGIHVLVNNAGNDLRHHTLDVSIDQWRSIMASNLDHQFFAAQAVIPAMIEAGSGSIINMSSNCFLLGQNDDYPVYMTAKAAIYGMTRALAREFGVHRIRVNCILPGWVMTEQQIICHLTPEAEKDLMKTQALKDKIDPDDIARTVLFLAADDSRMLTKQMIIVDGGRV